MKPGDKYHRLTVISRCPKETGKWIFQCECGKVRSIFGYAVKKGGNKSCGCLRRELMTAKATKHGFEQFPEYSVYKAMIKRCENKNHDQFYLYGMRGIFVCEEWKKDFLAFKKDMGPRPSVKHSLDRIDNDGPYSPENCRWATAKEQANNRGVTVKIEIDGVVKAFSDWCLQTGIKYETARGRYSKGITGAAIFEPPKR